MGSTNAFLGGRGGEEGEFRGGIEARASGGPHPVKRLLDLWWGAEKAAAKGREVFIRERPAGPLNCRKGKPSALLSRHIRYQIS